ncbi:NAD(P)H-quinone oxidoreductase subunit 4 [Leptolyngbya cf. ectocarpi LEGE 11479]|uniref:NAD(P)H-quinone oxidoreductase chain 4 n=1 Tax=Leptolyngbya cf. ectocarpi LEGE 11479 TaxID=1828722 RepID=A0A928ZXF5_LEPEC|nr:NAD(P)H-quinone oxidoreductase subunit 4 [Leptolyngbya ectocarpi]MBE9069226.1 NAD(P)H-quinone oxidoreductase subunit 4 [Leptolyngbya cf. ectocarpi LEGE 11479]
MIVEHFPWLTALVLFPLLAAIPIPLLPDSEGKTLRWYTLGACLVELALIFYTFITYYDIHQAGLQLVDNYAWVPQIGLNWSLAADGLSMPLVVLSGLVTTLAAAASWNITMKPRLYFSLLLLMYSAQLGVFLSQDMLMFFIMWELELVPVYLLISIWGGQRRLYAATKFILYTAIGSIFILIAALAMAFYGDNVTFNFSELAAKDYSLPMQLFTYTGFLIAFGVKLPIFPFHTWLPDAHSEAPAPVSMILAGVLLKMAGYGLIRMNIEMLPDAHVYFAPALAIVGVINIVYASLAAFGQDNLKRRMAYSSVAHMGFVLLGLAAFTTLGLSGALLQMISHGLIASVLFFLAGVTYERTHTLAMDKMGGMGKAMPVTFGMFTAGAMASLALPGMSGFAAELAIFLGFSTSDAYSIFFKAAIVILAAVGVILSPIYLLSMLRRIFFGKPGELEVPNNTSWDLKPREAFVAVCLLLPIIGIGLYPKLATQTYDVKTAELNNLVKNVRLAQDADQGPLYYQVLTAPDLLASRLSTTSIR